MRLVHWICPHPHCEHLNAAEFDDGPDACSFRPSSMCAACDEESWLDEASPVVKIGRLQAIRGTSCAQAGARDEPADAGVIPWDGGDGDGFTDPRDELAQGAQGVQP